MKATVYQVYKVTNLLNGKVYIGVHKQTKSKVEYLGSGKLINLSIQKYGRENFKKEILFEFATSEEAYAKEAELVNKDFIESPMTYNIQLGGTGGWEHYGNRNKGMVVVKDSNGCRFLVEKTDPRYLSGDLVPWNRGRKKSKSSNAKRSLSMRGIKHPKIECPLCHLMVESVPFNYERHANGKLCKSLRVN